MAAFHVFVEGAADASPQGLSRLADAIAKHYGLPAAELLARLQKGRFRVKGNIDRATADTYVRDLERLGARCVIEEANADNSARTTPLPFPAARPATPPAGMPAVRPSAPTLPQTGSALPPRTSAATPPAGTSALPPRASAPSPVANQQYQSGLSAAFSGELPAADLGALGQTGAQFAISSIDGVDDGASSPPAASFEPPGGGGLPASIGPAPDKPATKAKGDKPKDVPLDMFAPPDAADAELAVDIADDERDFNARKRTSTPPPVDDASARPSSQKIPTTSQKIPTTPTSQKIPARPSQPSMQAPNATVDAVGGTVAPSSFGPLGDPKIRFVAGVLLAIILGFVPAHFVASMKEDSAYETIDRKVIAAQQAADSPELYANLDRVRAEQLGRKETEQRNAAIIGFAVWALVGAAIAFVWFKKIPWDA